MVFEGQENIIAVHISFALRRREREMGGERRVREQEREGEPEPWSVSVL